MAAKPTPTEIATLLAMYRAYKRQREQDANMLPSVAAIYVNEARRVITKVIGPGMEVSADGHHVHRIDGKPLNDQ